MAKKLRVVLYLRCSDLKQDTSVADQRAAAHEYAKKHGYVIVGEYVDDGISGDDTEKRHGFLRMREDCPSGKFDAVLCWDQNRFGRADSLDQGYWVYPFRRAGVKFITLNEGVIDWNDYGGRLMYAIKQEAAHDHNVKLSRDVLRGQIAAAKAGSWLGSVPYGYKLVGERKNKRLELGDAAHGKIVKRIFREYVADDRSMNNIATRLNADSIISSGGGKWKQDAIRWILRNPAYAGTYRFNTYSRAKYHAYRDGEIQKGARKGRNPESDWIVFENHHPAIVDAETFALAQAKLDKTITGRRRHTDETNPYLLNGKLRCGRCGGMLWGMEPLPYARYECSTRKYDGKDACDGCNVREDQVLDYVSGYLLESLTPEGDIRKLYKAAKKGKLSEGDMPTMFAKLKKLFLKSAEPKRPAANIQRELKSVTAQIDLVRRNVMYMKDAKNIAVGETEIHKMEEHLEELNRELKAAQPKVQDVNQAVLSAIESFVLLTGSDRELIKSALRHIDAIDCYTILRGTGNARRHVLSIVRLDLVGVIPSKLNPHHPGKSRGCCQ